MRDMFDEFMEELRRRQKEQEEAAAKKAADGADGGKEPADEEPKEDHAVDERGPDESDRGEEERPRPIFGRGGWGRRPGRVVYGGPSGELPEFHIGRGWIVLGIIGVAVIVLLSLFSVTIGFITDAIWFGSVSFGSVFWTRVGTQILLFVGGGLLAIVFLWLNLWLSGRFIPKDALRGLSLDDFLDRFNVDRYFGGGMGGGPFGPRAGGPAGRAVPRPESVSGGPDIGRPVFWTLLVIGLLVALGLGGLLSGSWTTIQLFIHRVSFGQADPTFGKDVSFYMFELPFYRLAQSYANTLLLLAFALSGIRYLIAWISGARMSTPVRLHLGLLVTLYLWSVAIGYQLDRYELVYSGTSGIFQGASYADVNATAVALNVMTVLAAFAGAFVLAFAYTRLRGPLALTLLVWLGAYFVLDVGYPQLVQRFSVVPNQQAQESPYIKNNIDMTRLAFNLNGWTGSTYTPAATITQQAVQNNPGTIQNVRLWDTVPLAKTLDQVQIIRTYYTFTNVNTDRYTFTDAASCSPNPAPCVRQVMLAGRELDSTKLTDQSWVNEHITYTHGIGVAMVPVNEVGNGGQPNLLIENLPPTSVPGTPTLTQSRIYFGLQENAYVIVGASSPEFDYPSASGDQTYSWTGNTGIKLDTPLMRLLYAARFGDLNLLISNQITGSSQLLYNRSITDRVQAIAPFLRYDKDPYLVVTADGQLDYVLDAYTTSADFPDSQPYDPGSDPTVTGLAGDAFNYVRNSVKVVMNAYDGTMSFYVADPKDPIIQDWEGVFPNLFKPISAMPADLKQHIRYPQDIFGAQTAQFAQYHVTDPGVFYQKTQFWQIPQSQASSSGPEQLPLESFYVEMRVPGQTGDTFMLLQPMVLQARNNMIAWVAAYNDYPTTYGQVSVFDFPESTNVFGPVQVESLIQQNQQISQQITLWEGAGSHVVLGNLLVIPLQDTLMYIEPVYLQSASSPLPVFQKVVVGTPTQVVWGNSLTDALNQIYAGQGATGGGAGPSPGPSASAGPTATSAGTPTAQPSVSLSGTAQQLVAQANAHYAAAQQALRNGDLATYQKELNIVGQLLAQLQSQLGTPAPSGQ